VITLDLVLHRPVFFFLIGPLRNKKPLLLFQLVSCVMGKALRSGILLAQTIRLPYSQGHEAES